MTDLVPFTPTWTDVVAPSVALAERIAGTEFVPKDLRGRPEAVLAAILTGHEIGIGPMAALAKIHVIDGRPTMAAELMRGLGLAAGHDFWVEDSTTTRVVVAGKRAASAHVTKVTWTLDDARKAGLSGRPTWTRYPRQMLLARATAELARLVWADALGGIAYATEELQDEPSLAVAEPQDVQVVTTPAPTKRTRRRTPTAPTEPPPIIHDVGAGQPPLPGEEEGSVTPIRTPIRFITDPQRRKLHAALNDAGIDGHDDRVALVSGYIGRDVASSNDLHADEASRLIDAIDALNEGQAELVLDKAGTPVGIQPVEADQ